MIKRKYLDRSNWKRVIEKSFKSKFINSEEFSGNISLISIEKVSTPLVKSMLGKDYCLANEGFTWLEQLPKDKNYCITTMFDDKGEIVQWYFDVIKAQGVTNRGVAYFDDLFLDVVVLPHGEIILLDEDELQEALTKNEITQMEYDMAYEEANRIMETLASDIDTLANSSKHHLKVLMEE